MNALSNFDKTDREYSLAPLMTWLGSGGQRSSSQQAIKVKFCEHHISWNINYLSHLDEMYIE